ncbi:MULTISPECIES: DUF2240 family protein [Haloarcula]|uniref:DUF2240 family protein n=2 Tax=Haloarcula TaxID=2237 RepID=A0A482T0M5_HALHI|nr:MULTISPECIES: DUF2240 family protein [Haloarcula]AJF24735.1 hypothetical protein SG26_02900 [Haloarcula sp. CBA1115]EMA18051.1 hypothetical protein C442_14455 [Haloarcula amylolytica JCM 13557]KZX49185.1 hypothetical protein AV929_11590 [Haloarcula sp. K1]MCJ0619351.1 DUF2240 family protein [Haloarcula hispanica]RYJ09848.1 DUF2240 family protein [Haloarcula hispanica]
MSLKTAVAAPFRQRGTDRMAESEFVVALSLDRNWFSPDQAKTLVDVAASEGLVERDEDDLVVAFDATHTAIPDGFTPGEEILQSRSTFERVLDAVVEAGIEKQTAVAGINALQSDIGVTLEAAAVVYARSEGVDVEAIAADVREEL